MGALHRELKLFSADALELYGQRWEPQGGETVAEVLIVPGFADHGNRYREVAHTFAEAGIATVAVDMRGHGRSEGPRGFVRHFDDYHDDVRAGLATLGKGPKFIYGHSMGGLIALDLLSRGRDLGLRGVVLSCPFLGLAMKVPPAKLWVAGLAASLYPRLSMPSGVDPANISRDPVQVDAYARDPLVFKSATVGWFQELTLAQQRVRDLRAVEQPLLLVYSEEDRLVDGKLTTKLNRQLECKDKTVVLRPGGYHEPHSDIDRGEMIAKIRDWIRAHV